MNDDFLDSSIILYQFDTENLSKRDIALGLIHGALYRHTACISFQVVQEVLNGMTRKFARPATSDEAEQFMDDVLRPLWVVMPSRRLYSQALGLQRRYRFTFYDSLILAAALEAGCTRLLSEDMQHGQRIESLRIENPFA